MRLGYMGHLTLIAEEVVKFSERHPQEVLGHKVLEKVSDSVWVEYVEDTLAATRERDNAILGGVRPDMSVGTRQAALNAVQAVQAQAFNAHTTNAGSLTLGSTATAELDSIDLQNGNSSSAGVGAGSGSGSGSGAGGGGGGGLLSGFGSSSDEEDEDMEHDDDDDEVTRLGLSSSSDQVGDLTDFLFDDDLEDIFEDMTFL